MAVSAIVRLVICASLVRLLREWPCPQGPRLRQANSKRSACRPSLPSWVGGNHGRRGGSEPRRLLRVDACARSDGDDATSALFVDHAGGDQLWLGLDSGHVRVQRNLQDAVLLMT